MTNWHGYIVIERGTVGIGNWTSLIAVFEGMGTHDSAFPAENTHDRPRLDGDAVIYESAFDPTEITIEQFKELLAAEFGLDVADIEHTIGAEDYAGYGTTVWEFLYSGVVRFLVRRFGQGGTWPQSRLECLGYLAANSAEWEAES